MIANYYTIRLFLDRNTQLDIFVTANDPDDAFYKVHCDLVKTGYKNISKIRMKIINEQPVFFSF